MKVLTAGHCYVAANFENPEHGQTIQFIQKAQGKAINLDESRPHGINAQSGRWEYLDTGEVIPRQLDTVNDGTTNEELLAVLIDRLQYLNGKFPCRQNSIAITKLQEAVFWLNDRTAERKAAGVEGKAAPVPVSKCGPAPVPAHFASGGIVSRPVPRHHSPEGLALVGDNGQPEVVLPPEPPADIHRHADGRPYEGK